MTSFKRKGIMDRRNEFEKYCRIKSSPDFHEIIGALSGSALSTSGITGYPFVYYEKLPGNGRILGFKIKETDSHLILKCLVKNHNGRSRCFVSVESFQGIDGWNILKHLSLDIIPFFRNMEAYIASEDIDYPFVMTFYTKTGDIHIEELEDPKLQESAKPSI